MPAAWVEQDRRLDRLTTLQRFLHPIWQHFRHPVQRVLLPASVVLNEILPLVRFIQGAVNVQQVVLWDGREPCLCVWAVQMRGPVAELPFEIGQVQDSDRPGSKRATAALVLLRLTRRLPVSGRFALCGCSLFQRCRVTPSEVAIDVLFDRVFGQRITRLRAVAEGTRFLGRLLLACLHLAFLWHGVLPQPAYCGGALVTLTR